jgi:hypothetical protein
LIEDFGTIPVDDPVDSKASRRPKEKPQVGRVTNRRENDDFGERQECRGRRRWRYGCACHDAAVEAKPNELGEDRLRGHHDRDPAVTAQLALRQHVPQRNLFAKYHLQPQPPTKVCANRSFNDESTFAQEGLWLGVWPCSQLRRYHVLRIGVERQWAVECAAARTSG